MRITLSGCTTDVAAGREGKLLPEATAAAYARISRKPLPLAELRAEALNNYEEAQTSCDTIVHGMGHASVQEHAVLQFDIEGVSRLAVEAIEQHRLASYLERSYRYCPVARDDIYLPPALRASVLAVEIQDPISKMFDVYELLTEKLMDHHESTSDMSKAARRQAAQEDARYVLPLAITTSLGMTINCRSLSRMITTLRAYAMPELDGIADGLTSAGREVTPTLLRHLEPSLALRKQIKEMTAPLPEYLLGPDGRLTGFSSPSFHMDPGFESIGCGPNSLVGIIYELCAYEYDYLTVLEAHDSLPRSLELIGMHCCVTGSAVFYAQLKRHRMATIIPQPYEPCYGYYVPKAVQLAGLESLYAQALQEAWELHAWLRANGKHAEANYILPNATRRRIEFVCNLRELAHFCRLRRDKHAQAEIRAFADMLVDAFVSQISEETEQPELTQLAANFLFSAKDTFEANKKAALSGYYD